MPTPRVIDDEFKNLLRNVRNNLLSDSDHYLLIPDLPEDILNSVKSYREELRNITSKFGNEWKTEDDINWPAFPTKLLDTRGIPLMPN